MKVRPLEHAFYLGEDVVLLARRLLGRMIVSDIGGHRTAGIITETEAYAGITDRASHAYGGRRTRRTEPMYAQGGTAYVYLCYGMHHLFNVVTGPPGIPHAILVRAMVPVAGLDTMARRRGREHFTTRGPGTLAQALGITTAYSGADLITGPIVIMDTGEEVPARSITSGPRIGVEYAGSDALLPYRFRIPPSRAIPIPPAP